ncbi:hypothetical protein KVT40_006131 [Elsinoe batatas]|uniref:Uncharacterized protein n=1 Tax=Elsinoe batatas TaxID=2601811 RepID=A0A8K0KYQ6_9PEZI|nr:hypothetical protein KVT40_006131 [Elsinoe batatas]
MGLDNMGRVFLHNEQDISMFRDHMDIYQYFTADKRTFAMVTLIIFTVLSTITAARRGCPRQRSKNNKNTLGTNIRWIMPFNNIGENHLISPNESQKTVKTIVTGRESMGEMPDLVFARLEEQEKGEVEQQVVEVRQLSENDAAVEAGQSSDDQILK